MAQDKLSYAVIGAAMRVHRDLGPGLDEMFYHELLSEHLTRAGIEHLSNPRRPLVHRGHTADVFEPDLVLPAGLIPELKVLWAGFVPDNYVQLKCYLKFWHISVGLLFDFGRESLVHDRFIFTDAAPPPLNPAELARQTPEFVAEKALAESICASVARVAAVHGLGYRDTTYRGLLNADFTAEGLGCVPTPPTVIRSAGRALGESRLPCLVVENRCAVLVVSLRNEIHAADRAILQSCLKHLGLMWGIVVHFGKHQIEVRWVSAPRRTL